MGITEEQYVETQKKTQERLEALEKENKLLHAKVKGLKAAFKEKKVPPKEEEKKSVLQWLISGDE